MIKDNPKAATLNEFEKADLHIWIDKLFDDTLDISGRPTEQIEHFRKKFTIRTLEHIVRIIAPHLRGEFPREAVEAMADRLWHQGLKAGIDERDIWIAKVVDEWERLWNGGEMAAQESISKEGLEILRELAKLATSGKLKIPGDARELSDRAMVLLHKKPACKTCGGSGEKCRAPHNHEAHICTPTPCPDCKPKCPHKNRSRAFPGKSRCDECGEAIDARKGERRKGNEDLEGRLVPTGKGFVKVLYREKAWSRGRYSLHRRTGDRRD